MDGIEDRGQVGFFVGEDGFGKNRVVGEFRSP